MRVLQVNSAKGWGGGEVHCLSLCEELQRAGCEVILACRPSTPLALRAAQAGIETLLLPCQSDFDLLSAWHLAQFCRHRQIEIVHAHQVRDYLITYFAHLRGARFRRVLTRHVLYPMPRSLLYRRVLADVDAVIAVSAMARDGMLRHPGISAERTTIIHTGIRTGEFLDAEPQGWRHEFHIPPGAGIIGTVGTLSPQNGQAVLLRALPMVLSRHPHAAIALVGHDSGERAYLPEMTRLAISLGIERSVYFLGPREDLPGVLCEFDLFALPSLSESFGLALVEAMAAGRPVIASAIGGLREVVLHRETGLLVPPNDPRALAAAISRLLEYPEIAAEYARAGQQRALAQFDLSVMVEKTLEVYRRVLESVPSATRIVRI